VWPGKTELTSWIKPLRAPPMPLEMMSVVLALATMHGNISDHRDCTKHVVGDRLTIFFIFFC
jgi:hypothetical protein